VKVKVFKKLIILASAMWSIKLVALKSLRVR
jgi:hypothetical protein